MNFTWNVTSAEKVCYSKFINQINVYYCYFIGIPSGSLCGGESDNEIIEKHGGGRDLKRG